MRFLGTLPDEINSGLGSVVDGAIAGGAPEPPWIAVDDGTDAWVAVAAGCSTSERARGVIAASSDAALVTSLRLGIGGAMWLPPSSPGAQEAFASADSSVVPAEGYDADLVELLDDAEAVVIVTFVDRLFWRVQLGERRLVALLAELATAIGAPSAILPWPALLVQGVDSGTIVEGLRAVVLDAERVLPDVTVSALETGAPESATVEAVYRELLEDRPPGTVVGQGGRPLPVHELPRGQRVGWWRRNPDPTLPEVGWCATAVEVSHSRCRWRLDGVDLSGFVEEVLTGEELDRTGECVAVRFPGWASRDIRSGSPAGLLVTRLAEAAARRGLPLWIPNLDSDALRLALTLPGVLWVDGPAVPR